MQTVFYCTKQKQKPHVVPLELKTGMVLCRCWSHAPSGHGPQVPWSLQLLPLLGPRGISRGSSERHRESIPVTMQLLQAEREAFIFQFLLSLSMPLATNLCGQLFPRKGSPRSLMYLRSGFSTNYPKFNGLLLSLFSVLLQRLEGRVSRKLNPTRVMSTAPKISSNQIQHDLSIHPTVCL